MATIPLLPPPVQVSEQLEMVQLLYEVAYLEGRRRAKMQLSQAQKLELQALSWAFAGKEKQDRRRYRRLPLTLPAVVKIGTRLGRATILNMSAGGMLVAASIGTLAGDTILVKVGVPGSVQYSFPCTVRRLKHERGAFHLALELKGIPLELRYGEGRPRPKAPPAELPFCANGSGG